MCGVCAFEKGLYYGLSHLLNIFYFLTLYPLDNSVTIKIYSIYDFPNLELKHLFLIFWIWVFPNLEFKLTDLAYFLKQDSMVHLILWLWTS